MRLDLDEQGGWLITPVELARQLKMEVSDLQRQAALGLVDSRLDRGYGRDEGRSRVTVIVGKLGWQGIFRADGRLLSEFRWEPRSSAMTINRRKASHAIAR